jgi:hypothetical protein
MKQTIAIHAIGLLLAMTFSLHSQSPTDQLLQDYQNFLAAHKNLTASGIRDLYPPDEFTADAPASFFDALYADSVQKYYAFNESELELLGKHSFMVSDRVRYKNFGEAFYTIYKRDLPVYISSDAILHALHMSYSEILINIEQYELLPRLTALLTGLHDALADLEQIYAAVPDMREPLRDVDLYFTIPLLLLAEPAAPRYVENIDAVAALMNMIEMELPAAYPLFIPDAIPIDRDIDFSQFTPRGHYTQHEELTRYFQAMMWLGRTELYLVVPKSQEYNQLSEEERDAIGSRQTAASYLIAEALTYGNNRQYLEEMNGIVTFLVGESDNVAAEHLLLLKEKTGFEHAASLLEINTYRLFKEALESEPFARQKILSQMLRSDPFSPDKIEPASAFLLFGQRFIIDSFVMGSVVFDKVPTGRMLPKSADVLFAMGNNDALTVLENDLITYEYAPNLAALRYLIDLYEQDFWSMSLFNLWLNSIRQLNPPADRSPLPRFMQTEAWSNKSMTTQLASWAQLRHDNLLYGKQSYTGMPICSYPQSYVEPVPEFFQAVTALAAAARDAFNAIDGISQYTRDWIIGYFERLVPITHRLGVIAQKQIDGVDASPEEKAFLRQMLHISEECGSDFTGWFADLFIGGDHAALKQDYIVADVHTSPADEFGVLVGWVLHVGTGPLNLAVLTAELGDGNTYAFVGPVMSYYEHVSVNFKRLTDDEWAATFDGGAGALLRPEFTGSYLSTAGVAYYDDRYRTVSSVADVPGNIPGSFELDQNYPNPFNAGTMIGFRIPSSMADERVVLSIYNIQGQLVETLIDQRLPAGGYTARWDANAASGTYFYRLSVGGRVKHGTMMLIK